MILAAMKTIYAIAYVAAWKSQDFNSVWIHDLAIPVQRSSQLSYEGFDIGSWWFVGPKEPMRNECEFLYEIFDILNCGYEIK